MLLAQHSTSIPEEEEEEEEIMDHNEQLLLKDEYHKTLNNDFEANQLLDEIQTTIKEVQQSEFYQNMLQQLQNSPHFQNNIHSVLGNNTTTSSGNDVVDNRLQMVIFGLGTIQFNYQSHYQLAMAICLSRDLSYWIKETIHTFDPCTTPIDAKVMKALDIEVEYVNERLGRRVNGRPTLFYMPFVTVDNLENLFGVNWRPSDLKKIILFTNVYKEFDKEDLYAKSILKHTINFDCHYNYKGPLTGRTKWPFYDITCHFFNLSPETKLEMIRLRRHQDHEVLDEDKCLAYCLPSFRQSKDLTSPGHFEWHPHSSVEQRESLLGIMEDFRLATWPGRNEWCPPYRGWIKLNFSAANCSQQGGRGGVIGYGGIFHNENSECLHRYSGPVLDDLDEEDVADDLEFANAVALRRGLRLFKELSSSPNGRRLIIEGDSVSIVRWANRLVPPPKRLTEIFEEIHSLLSRMSFVIVHIYKQANSMAIDLASKGESH